jgi:hypothetical protein
MRQRKLRAERGIWDLTMPIISADFSAKRPDLRLRTTAGKTVFYPVNSVFYTADLHYYFVKPAVAD